MKVITGDELLPFCMRLHVKEVLVTAYELLHEEAKLLGPQVSSTKTKVQSLGDLHDNTVQSLHTCDEEVEVPESFTYQGNIEHNDGGAC